MTLRIGSVPYLNAKPLVDWFHAPECDADRTLSYDVPSELAVKLREDALDVANVSIFEAFQARNVTLIPNISISAYGAVKSVRLFSRVPLSQIRSIALDTSSLTSSALTKILVAEVLGLKPEFHHHPPRLEAMLARYDAGLIIGDLKLFGLEQGAVVWDLGEAWHELTGLPFVYAGWLARTEKANTEMAEMLTSAKAWGTARLEELAKKWAARLELPLDRSRDYLLNVMNYDLSPDQIDGMNAFHARCIAHGLVPDNGPVSILKI